MDLSVWLPDPSTAASFLGGGILGTAVTALIEGRRSRKALEEQWKAEQREVVAQILTHYQRTVNALAFMRVEGGGNRPVIIQDSHGFLKNTTQALDLMPRITLTVRNKATRKALTNYLIKLGLVYGEQVAPLLESAVKKNKAETETHFRMLKAQGAELEKYYEIAIDTATQNLGREPRLKNKIHRKLKGAPPLPEISGQDEQTRRTYDEKVKNRFNKV